MTGIPMAMLGLLKQVEIKRYGDIITEELKDITGHWYYWIDWGDHKDSNEDWVRYYYRAYFGTGQYYGIHDQIDQYGYGWCHAENGVDSLYYYMGEYIDTYYYYRTENIVNYGYAIAVVPGTGGDTDSWAYYGRYVWYSGYHYGETYYGIIGMPRKS